jgi:hypothetical protein
MATDTDHHEPARLIEDADTGDRFLIYGTSRGVRVELRYDGATLWMTQAQMAELFGVDRSVITKHLANVYEEGELDPEATSAKIAQVRLEGVREVTRQIEHYNIDAVISVGYRVSSTQGTLFRRWATDKLVQFASSGFVVDVERLKSPGEHDRVAELREIIRDIRSSEANVYAELRRICAMCQDYDGSSDTAREFYRRTQAKLFYAVTTQTPSEILIGRANAMSPNMGLQTWPKDEIRQQDALVAKNYLAPAEMTELNRLTTILLDIFEDQLDIGKLVTMDQAAKLLDQSLRNLNREVLQHGGQIRHDRAEASAKSAYKRYDEARRLARQQQASTDLSAIKGADKALPKSRAPRKPS